MKKLNAFVVFLVVTVILSALIMVISLARNQLRYGNAPETTTNKTYKGSATVSPTVTPTPTKNPTINSITSEIEDITVEPIDSEIESLTKDLNQL